MSISPGTNLNIVLFEEASLFSQVPREVKVLRNAAHNLKIEHTERRGESVASSL
jgi:hypothetical protein